MEQVFEFVVISCSTDRQAVAAALHLGAPKPNQPAAVSGGSPGIYRACQLLPVVTPPVPRLNTAAVPGVPPPAHTHQDTSPPPLQSEQGVLDLSTKHE